MSKRPDSINEGSLDTLADEAHQLGPTRKSSLKSRSLFSDQNNDDDDRFTLDSLGNTVLLPQGNLNRRDSADSASKKSVMIDVSHNETRYIEPRTADIYGFIQDEFFSFGDLEIDSTQDEDEDSYSNDLADDGVYEERRHPLQYPALSSQLPSGSNNKTATQAVIMDRNQELEEFYCKIFADSNVTNHQRPLVEEPTLDFLETRLSRLLIQQGILKCKLSQLQERITLTKTGPIIPSTYFLLEELVALAKKKNVLLREAKVRKYYVEIQEELEFWKSEFADLKSKLNRAN